MTTSLMLFIAFLVDLAYTGFVLFWDDYFSITSRIEKIKNTMLRRVAIVAAIIVYIFPVATLFIGAVIIEIGVGAWEAVVYGWHVFNSSLFEPVAQAWTVSVG